MKDNFFRGLSNFARTRYFSKRGKAIVINSWPKSGSTYLWNVLQHSTDFKRAVPTVEGSHANRTELDRRKLQKYYNLNYVCRLHMPATSRNVELCNEFSISPLLLVRNIFDVCVSLRDHFLREDTGSPSGWSPKGFETYTEEQQFEFIAHLHIPWFFNYLLSWESADLFRPLNWYSYEQMFKDPEKTVIEMLDKAGVHPNVDAIQRAINNVDGKSTRLNVGVSGRGKQLPDTVVEEIQRIATVSKLSTNLKKSYWHR